MLTQQEELLRVVAAFDVELSNCWFHGDRLLATANTSDGVLFFEVRRGELYYLRFSEKGIATSELSCTIPLLRMMDEIDVEHFYRKYCWITRALFLLEYHSNVAIRLLEASYHEQLEWNAEFNSRLGGLRQQWLSD